MGCDALSRSGRGALQVDGTANGIYKRVGPNDFQPIADLGTFSLVNPPPPDFQVDAPIGVQFAMEPIDQGFLVSDGHLSRILHVAIDGLNSEISVLRQFGNTVPTGLAGQFGTTYVAMLGSVEFYPGDAGVTAFGLLQPDNARAVASGVR
jgi:hypothetical protein